MRRMLPLAPNEVPLHSESRSVGLYRKVYDMRLTATDSLDDMMYSTVSSELKQPLRSQSFRHRARPHPELKRCAADEGNGVERRRSTPTVSRRSSLQTSRSRLEPLVRTDVWPEPKHMSEVEERFLKLPDSEDYTRVRQFKIDAKGAVVSRGDSFRRKKGTKGDLSPSPFGPEPAAHEAHAIFQQSRSASLVSSNSSSNRPLNGSDPDVEQATTSHPAFKIFVLGQAGSGKSSLISQFITSEYKNAFADEIEDYENTVSICIGGQECDLIFFEADPTADSTWRLEPVDAYVLVYSIDRKSSFRTAADLLEQLRHDACPTPIILAGNKVDLERKRAVSPHEVRGLGATYSVAHFEISVALNHDVDDLLVGIVAEIKEAGKAALNGDADENRPVLIRSESFHVDEPEFKAAIRRFSQRKKRQMGATSMIDLEGSKCTNLTPGGLIDRFRRWRKESKC